MVGAGETTHSLIVTCGPDSCFDELVQWLIISSTQKWNPSLFSIFITPSTVTGYSGDLEKREEHEVDAKIVQLVRPSPGCCGCGLLRALRCLLHWAANDRRLLSPWTEGQSPCLRAGPTLDIICAPEPSSDGISAFSWGTPPVNHLHQNPLLRLYL